MYLIFRIVSLKNKQWECLGPPPCPAPLHKFVVRDPGPHLTASSAPWTNRRTKEGQEENAGVFDSLPPADGIYAKEMSGLEKDSRRWDGGEYSGGNSEQPASLLYSLKIGT